MQTGTGAKKRYTFFTDIRRNPLCYLLILPALIYTFIFSYMTLPYIAIAFQRFNYRTGIFGSEFIGLTNFEFFIKSPKFLEITFNTVYLNFLFIVSNVILSVFFAILLNECRNRMFAKTTQSLLLLPYFLSWVVVSYMVYGILGTDFGALNKVLQSVGLEPVNWYQNAKVWPAILVIIRAWKGTGLSVIIYLAAITGMDPALIEAARIDGANRVQAIWHITLPLLIPTISILTLLAVGRIFYGDFGMFYAIIGDNGVLYETTDVVDTYVFRALRKTGDPSQAMAVGLFQSLMGFIFVFASNWFARRFSDDGALF